MKRDEGESIQAFRLRRSVENSRVEAYLKQGKLLWNSVKRGKYVKKKHGPI
jgi:hypothetical protein